MNRTHYVVSMHFLFITSDGPDYRPLYIRYPTFYIRHLADEPNTLRCKLALQVMDRISALYISGIWPFNIRYPADEIFFQSKPSSFIKITVIQVVVHSIRFFDHSQKLNLQINWFLAGFVLTYMWKCMFSLSVTAHFAWKLKLLHDERKLYKSYNIQVHQSCQLSFRWFLPQCGLKLWFLCGVDMKCRL